MKNTRPLAALLVALCCLGGVSEIKAQDVSVTPVNRALPALFDDIEKRTFNYFWQLGNPSNGLVPDRWPSPSFASIASVGFALPTYGVGVERGWISREQAAERTLSTLRFFVRAPQAPNEKGASGYQGFFYHFLDMNDGTRFGTTELSTVDTTLLFGGMLFAQSYFDRDTRVEREIRELAEILYRRADWTWFQKRGGLISMGWHPETGMIEHDWKGYNEALLVYILGLGSPTHPIATSSWNEWQKTYDSHYSKFYGQEHLNFAPMFGHQYSHIFVDFRGIRDSYMRGKGFDYFENSRRATYSQRAYAIANPRECDGYGPNVWGLTASDGPLDGTLEHKGTPMLYKTYTARGAGNDYIFDDCTIVPTAALGSLPFAPEIVVAAAEEMYRKYGRGIFAEYGFLDAFNPSFRHKNVKLHHGSVVDGIGWVDGDYIGIDQGAIILGIANYRNDFVWNVLRRNPHIVRGLKRAGFTGGWIDKAKAAE